MMQCNVHYATSRLQVTLKKTNIQGKLQYLLLNNSVTRYSKINLNKC